MIDPFHVIESLEDLPNTVIHPVKLSTYGKQKPVLVSNPEWTGILLFPERITKNMDSIMRRNWSANLPTFGVVDAGAVVQLWYTTRNVFNANRENFGSDAMFGRNLMLFLKQATDVDRDDWNRALNPLQRKKEDENDGWI
jgi:hypothetical protein